MGRMKMNGGCTSRTRSRVKRYRRSARAAAYLQSKEMNLSADDRIPVPACRQRHVARLLKTPLHRLHAAVGNTAEGMPYCCCL